MENLKYSYMTNMWGLYIPYPVAGQYEEWNKHTVDNAYYYLDWDKILKYHVAAEITGIEVMFHMLPYVKQFFGEPARFTDFVKERGLEKVTGVFSIAVGSENKESQSGTLAFNQKIIDFAYGLGAENINIMPASGYYGNGPLSANQLKNSVECINEIGKRAADKGIELCIHSEFWCAVNKYDLERFLELTDPRYVGFCLDTAQVAILGFDPADFYEKYRDRIHYFHLKDTTTVNAPDNKRFAAGAEFPDEGERWFWELGAGKVDFKKLWKLLKKYNHKGWMVLETDGTPDPMATMLLSKWYIDHELKPIYQ